jgi:hypothetical protein
MLTKENNLLSPQMRLMSGDHSKMWPVEKALSLSLIFLIPAAIAMPNPIFDNLAAVAAVIHFHWYDVCNVISIFFFFLLFRKKYYFST